MTASFSQCCRDDVAVGSEPGSSSEDSGFVNLSRREEGGVVTDAGYWMVVSYCVLAVEGTKV